MRKPKTAGSDWAKQMRFDMQFAEGVLLKQGQVRPMFVIRSKEAMHIVGVGAPDDDAKKRVYAMMQLLCIAHDAVALTFITEAWIRTVAKMPGESEAEHNERAFAVLPSKAEDRREVVMVQTSYRDDAGKHVLIEVREIERRANGKPSALIAWEGPSDEAQLEGRIADIFPDEPPTATDRETAAEVLALLNRLGLGIEPVTMPN